MLTFSQAKEQYEQQSKRIAELNKLRKYYLGKDNEGKWKSRKNKDDMFVRHAFPQYITTITTGYVGDVSFTNTDDNDALKELLQFNDETTINSRILRYMSIYGECYEYDWLDEDGNYCFDVIDPRNCVMITDGKLRPSVTDAMIFDEIKQADGKTKVTMEVYDAKEYCTYSYIRDSNDTGMKIDSFNLEIPNTAHMMGRCPVVYYQNNEWKQSDFEQVITLIDAYNTVVSNSVNDTTDQTDALMKLVNLSATTSDELAESIAMGAVKVEEGGDVGWVIKSVNDVYVENIKNRLKSDVHKFSYVPDMSDEQFAANASGIAMKYKLMGLEQVTAEKKTWMRKALRKRLELINEYLTTKGSAIDMMATGFEFDTNIPQDGNAIVERVAKLQGIVSKTTQLGQLGKDIVPDIKHELELIDEEKPDEPTFVPGTAVEADEED